MNFLLDCALDKVNDKMSLYDYSNGQLANKLPDIGSMVLKSTRTSLNNEIANFAKAQHGKKLHSSRPRFPIILKFFLKKGNLSKNCHPIILSFSGPQS
jgi:hypothetical protein